MKLMHIALATLMLSLMAGSSMAQKGQTLVEGETVIAANVKTGAQFLAIVRGDQPTRIFYSTPEGVRVPMTPMVPLTAGQCSPGWSLECHQDFSQVKRICFCVAGEPGSGSRTIDISTGEILW